METRLHITELALNHSERMLDLSPYLWIFFISVGCNHIGHTSSGYWLIYRRGGGPAARVKSGEVPPSDERGSVTQDFFLDRMGFDIFL